MNGTRSGPLRSHDLKLHSRESYIRRLRKSRLRSEFHTRIASDILGHGNATIIVDIGCGPGLLGKRIRELNPTARIIGIDIDRRMLSIAQSAEGLESLLASASALPIKDVSIPVIVSSASLKDWADPSGGFREIARVLRIGGTAFIFEFITKGPGSHPPRFLWRFGLLSEVFRFLGRFLIPFSLNDVQTLAQGLASEGTVEVSMISDLGASRLAFTK